MQEDPQRSRDFILANQDDLAQKTVDRQWALQPDLEIRYGNKGRSRCLEDVRYHLKYLAEAVGAGQPELFANYLAWGKTMLLARNIPAKDLLLNLKAMLDVLKAEMPLSMRVAVIASMQSGVHGLDLVGDVSSFLDPQHPLAELADKYLKALLRYERNGASELILTAVKNNIAIKDIYSNVFEQCQYEIGRLWQSNALSVAHEHYCTASTQFIMCQLYPYIFRSDRRTKGTIVAACVTGELHEVGARMLCDLLEMEDWNTIYLGANVPSAGIVEVLHKNSCDILAISASMTFHLGAVREVIATVRAARPKTKILVGGYAFKIAQDLWREVGADYWARNASDAIALIEEFRNTTAALP